MIRISLAACCTLFLFATACERHPLEGESPLPVHGAAGEKHAAAKHEEAAKPATAEKPGEAPKFFPGKQ